MQDITEKYVYAALPRRAPDDHKGSCGTVVAAAGSLRYRGAAALCVEAALRSGAGLVFLAAPEPVIQLVLTRTPECCALPCRTGINGAVSADAAVTIRQQFEGAEATLLAGPGLGNAAGAVCNALLEKPDTWHGIVLDADALNALARGKITGSLPENTILTPHAGEAARLLGCTPDEIQADRPSAARTIAGKYCCTTVLKGHETLVATPEGTLYRNTTGNAGLAVGGSGDVLAGMIAALLAQGLSCLDAAYCGVWLHGAAGDLCSARRSMAGMLPHDILDDLGTLYLRAEHRTGR